MFLLAFKETSERCFAAHWAYMLAVGIANHHLFLCENKGNEEGEDREGEVKCEELWAIKHSESPLELLRPALLILSPAL